MSPLVIYSRLSQANVRATSLWCIGEVDVSIGIRSFSCGGEGFRAGFGGILFRKYAFGNVRRLSTVFELEIENVPCKYGILCRLAMRADTNLATF